LTRLSNMAARVCQHKLSFLLTVRLHIEICTVICTRGGHKWPRSEAKFHHQFYSCQKVKETHNVSVKSTQACLTV